MRLTDKDKIKELETLQKHNVLMTNDDYKELKLGLLENIEEELSISLITLFKALREDGIWVRWNNKIVNIEPNYLRVEIDCSKPLTVSIKIQELYFEDLDCVMDTTGQEWFMDEYGKTWALTKEELEK